MNLFPLGLALIAVLPCALTVKATVFNNYQTAHYLINSLPDINLPLGENYAGRLPISDNKNETRELFFWFWPTVNPDPTDEIVIWLQGGPGCSSLNGIFEESGPIVWYPGSAAPVRNPWSLHRLTNVLYVDQPVGTGYSPGEPTIHDDKQLAQQFLGFYKNFKDLFGVQKFKTYITGESYAGYYVPNIAAAFIDAYQNSSDKDADYFEVAGTMLHSPIVGEELIQENAATLSYIRKWRDILLLNDTAMAILEKRYLQCGFQDYYEKWFQFPALSEPIPRFPFGSVNETCGGVFGTFCALAKDANPCFDWYHIPSYCPIAMNILPDPDLNNYAPGTTNYFNRTDVKQILGVPSSINFTECSYANVYDGNGIDYTIATPPAIDGTLQKVIEFTNNTIIGNGEFDAGLTINGTLLTLQNMTWAGHRGFTSYPTRTFYAPKPAGLELTLGQSITGSVGTWVSQRGLTYFTVKGAGHAIWSSVPAAAFRSFELLLGRISDLGSTEDYSINV